MALTLVQEGIFANIMFTDIADDDTTRRVQVRWDTDLTTTIANALAHAGLWAAVTKSGVEKFQIVLEYSDTDPADAGAENQEVAHCVMKLAVVPPAKLTKRAVLEIPAPAASLHLTSTGQGYNTVDITDAGLVALFDDFKAAGSVYLSHGQDATVLEGGIIHHKSSKKG